MNCMAACGSTGQPGSPCSYICKLCGTKCEGKIAKSLSVSIGKNSFKCQCANQYYNYNNCNNTNNCLERSVKRRIDPEFNEVF